MMLSTTNYLARKFGIRAGQPGFIGMQLAKELGNTELKIVPTNYEFYTQIAHKVRNVLKDYDESFEPMGLDESYLDFTQHLTKRLEMSEKERTIIWKVCPNCKEDNISGSATCNSCNNNLAKTFGIEVDDAVNEMRSRVENEVKLTCSAGIGPNRLVAKIASGERVAIYVIPY